VVVDDVKIKLTKTEVATRHLRTAIRLWFADGDPVSIYTLAYAAHEITHTLHKKRGGKHGLLFDSPAMAKEVQERVTNAIKRRGNFFKHANRDATGTLVFDPDMNELIMIACASTLHSITNEYGREEFALHVWMFSQNPEGFIISPENAQSYAFVKKNFQRKADFLRYVDENWGEKVRWLGGYTKPPGF
jgi:hypothetical protein